LHKQIDVPNGAIASDIEARTFYWIRKELGLGVHLSREMMKSGGYSETVDANEISVLEIEKFVKGLIKGLHK
jgi:hypothetical protein